MTVNSRNHIESGTYLIPADVTSVSDQNSCVFSPTEHAHMSNANNLRNESLHHYFLDFSCLEWPFLLFSSALVVNLVSRSVHTDVRYGSKNSQGEKIRLRKLWFGSLSTTMCPNTLKKWKKYELKILPLKDSFKMTHCILQKRARKYEIYRRQFVKKIEAFPHK